MALEYALEMQLPEDPAQVVVQLGTQGWQQEEGGMLTAPGVIAFARAPTDLAAAVVQDEFGFTSRVHLGFRLDKFADTDAARLHIVCTTAALLQTFDGDAVLLFNGEYVVLLRTRGALRLNRELGFWTSERLAAVALPCELASLPNI